MRWISTLGMEAAYIPMPVKPENLEAALRALPKMGFQGVNLTVPHKETAVKLVDTLDAAARRTGAVNTIVTDMAVLEKTPQGLRLAAIAADVSLEQLKASTGCEIIIPGGEIPKMIA